MEMRSLLKCMVLVIVTIALVQAQDEPPKNGDLKFDCRRRGSACYGNSTCNGESGECDCEEGFGHYDCRYNTSMVTDCAQTTVCLNDGVCTLDTKLAVPEEMCHCTEQYLEPDCDENRVKHTCSHDRVNVKIVPAMGDGTFEGVIYVKDNGLSEECRLSESPDTPGAYEASLMYDRCGNAFDFMNADGKKVRGFTLMISYQSEVITDMDESVNIYCIFPESGENVKGSLDAVSKGVEQTPIEAGSKEEKLSPLIVKFLDEAGNEVDPTVPSKLGAKMNMQFELDAGELFNSYRIDNIVAHNGKDEPTELEMVETGCVPKDLTYIVNEFSENDDGTMKNLKYNQFQFLDSNKVVFKYSVRFCAEEMSDQCNKTECSDADHLTSDSFNAGRRKRQAEEGIEVREFETTILVELPPRFGEIPNKDGTKNQITNEISTKPTDCKCNQIYVIVVVVLAVLLVVVGALSFFFCLRAKQGDRKRGTDNYGYRN